MTCIIIEDQPPAQRILKKYIEDLGTLELKAIFSDPLQALDYLRQESVDLLFLDIHLPVISGFDFLKSLNHPPPTILTTAFPDYALESYDLAVVDYLLKPFSFQRFVRAVCRVPNQTEFVTQQAPIRQEVFVKSGYDHIKVRITDIQYIKSDADYTELVLPHRKLLSPESLRHWTEELAAHRFVRIHKSYIIQIENIEKISGNQVWLSNGDKLPIGRAYKEQFVKQLAIDKGQK